MNKSIKTIMLGLAVLGIFAGANVSLTQASSATCTSLLIDGTVQTWGAPTTVQLTWGTDASAVLSGIGQKTSTQTFTTDSSYSFTLTGLNPSTTYYVMATFSNRYATKNTTAVPQTTQSCGYNGGGNYNNLSVTTLSASSISMNNATLNGSVTGNGTYVTTWFEWGPTQSYGNRTPDRSTGTGYANMNEYISGLNPNTVYYFHAMARDSQGNYRDGGMSSFTTSLNYNGNPCYYSSCGTYGQPSVTTTSASNIAAANATLNGFVSNNNGSNVTTWFEWGPTPNYGNTTNMVSSGSGNPSFSAYIQGLNPNTTYYYRAVARNDQNGVPGYGLQSSFTTVGSGAGSGTSNTLGLLTSIPTRITDTSAQLNGIIVANGGLNTNAYFEWGTTTAFGNRTNSTALGTTIPMTHSDTISGLVKGTTYYYRIVAENASGSKAGYPRSFVAGQTAPVAVVIGGRSESVTTTVGTTTAQSLITLSVSGGSDSIAPNERKNYTVTWKNESAQALHNVALRVTLPESLTFVAADKGTFSATDNTVAYNVRDLTAGEAGSLTITVTAGSELKNGELVVVVGDMVYTDTKNVQGDVLAYATQTVFGAAATDNGFGASVFGAGFFPSTLFGWILLIILILLLVLIGNHLYGRFSNTAGAAAHH